MSIYVGTGRINYPAMRGPCPYGYHVPTDGEWGNVVTAGVALGAWTSSGGDNFRIKMKIPFAGFRSNGGGVTSQGSIGEYHSCKANTTTTIQTFRITSTTISYGWGLERRLGLCVRPFKDDPVIPTSSWTTIYQGTGSAGIFWNSSSGLISISSNGTTWYTIADKNLGATTVYNDGDTLSEANCGKYFQFGNNYPFPRTGSVTTGSAVDASAYGPGNWYYSNIFRTSANPRDTSGNRNLRGGIVGAVKADVKDICVGAGVNDYSAMQGPCPDGFHIPTIGQWTNIKNAGVTLGAWTSSGGNNVRIYLKMPFAGDRNYNGSIRDQGTQGGIWLGEVIDNNRAGTTVMQSNYLAVTYITKSLGRSVRPMKDNPVAPDSTWTTLYDGSSIATGAGIFWSKGLGLISISSNGTTWYTIADKNLGAKVVYNDGDTLSQDNCGLYYQYGNNYGFPWTGTVTTSSTLVYAIGYGPGNYYISDKFTSATSNPYGWDSSYNYDIRGYKTGIQTKGNVKHVYVGTTPARPTYNPGIYWNKAKGLISISSDGKNWYTIADKNLGAKVVYNDGDTLSQDNCGYYYQWGNNYGFAWTGSVTTSTTKVDTTNYGPTNPYYGSTFITVSSSPYDWASVQNNNLRGRATNTDEARKGPCPTLFHTPQASDWSNVINAGVNLGAWTTSSTTEFKKYLKLPFAGYRNRSNSNVGGQGTTGEYWLINRYDPSSSYYRRFNSSGTAQTTTQTSFGTSIRPFKNEPVVPDNSRTVLYQPS